ncbi:Gfo/Idh/MocA family protein [uncultured Megasphaera sp.]|uniref:Gfo/Idh/MocA family protein n=1 Tax=uncultured Megasphaera sp. TaxID=165188 RepID=UPI00265CE0BB|nr:Gfo/Idh/MocA family oxidoreductase [uncultured Megasphaera sp.]
MNQLRYNWAMIGCGTIAHEFAQGAERLGGRIYGVGNRTQEKAAAFARQYGIDTVYDRPEDAADDPNVDIVYIATPHNRHIEYILPALKAGKHVLCEKAITLNSGELAQAMAAAQEHGCILAEGMTLYHMPLYEELRQRFEAGALGRLRLVQASFGSYKPYDMTNRFFSKELAGGALLDIGVYALSFARWFLSAKPTQVLSQAALAPSGVDEQSGILLQNEAGEMAVLSLSLHAKQPKRGTAVFDRGYVEIYDYPRGSKAVVTYTDDGRQEIIEAGQTDMALCYEILHMEQAAAGEGNAMYLQYTADVMETMTTLRRQWGLTYPEEA